MSEDNECVNDVTVNEDKIYLSGLVSTVTTASMNESRSTVHPLHLYT